ncbi:LOC105229976 [Sergentomyia squamirostris]
MQTLGKVIIPLFLFVFVRDIHTAPTPGLDADSPLQVITILSPENARYVGYRDDRSHRFHDEDLPPEKDSSEIVIIQPLPPRHLAERHLRMLGVAPRPVGHDVPLNFAAGAYPVYYAIAHANGSFGRNIRALPKDEIDNYISS